MVLRRSFLSFSNADIKFDVRELTSRKYTIVEIIPTARQGKLIDKHKFVEVALDKDLKTFIAYVIALEAFISIMIIHFIRELLLAALEQNKTPTEVSIK